MGRSRQFQIFGIVLVMIFTSLACAMPTAPETPTPIPGMDKTSIALGVQQTSVAIEKATLAARAAATATLPPMPTVVEAVAAAKPTDTAVPLTNTPLPPTAPPPPTDVPPTATATLQPSATPVDINALIRGANVLVYEDMLGYYDRQPIVHQAISEMNFSGGRVIEVGDALGKFKEQLLNTTNWDLIIVAAEYRSVVQGEFWKYVYDQVNRGAAVAIETWYMDRHYTDIEPLLNKCGFEFQKNWLRGPNYNLVDYPIYWLQPDHPFFQPPDEPVTLANPNYLYWVPPLTDDAGDLIQVASSGDGVLLAGTSPSNKNKYGVVGTCLKGTMIIQTFSSHDYKRNEVVKMWKNYMRYTLTNHFEQKK